MNIPSAYSPPIVGMYRHEEKRKRIPVERDSPPIEDVQEAVEESFIRLRCDPSFGLSAVIEDVKPREDGSAGLMYDVTTTLGRFILCFGNSKRKLRRLTRRVNASCRKHAQPILVNIGEKKAHLLTKIANCLRTIFHAILSAPDPEIERKKQQRREERAKWVAAKNFQPAFC